MLPLTIVRRWMLAGQSRSAKWLRGALLVWLTSVVVVGMVSSVNGSASADDAVAGPASAGRLAAVRFIVAQSSPAPGEQIAFEVWVDGKRRINGLAANIVSPYLLVGSGIRSLEIRRDGSVVVGEVRDVEGGSSTTFVAAHGSGPARLLGVPDSKSHDALSVRMINATSISQTLQVPGDTSGATVVVAPFASSNPVPIPAAGAPALRFEGVDLTFDTPVVGAPKKPVPGASSATTGVGSQLLIVAAATDGSGGYSALSFPSTRYPASLLPVDEGAPSSALDAPGRPPEFWIRRFLAALVLVLVVAATITTLRSFRVQSLHSRVRARME